MKNFSFGVYKTTPMKKLLVLAFVAFTFVAAKAQEVTVAYALDEESNPLYGDIYILDGYKSTPFYVIVDDVSPINCNKMKVSAYYKDYASGEASKDYWVYQGTFDFPITPYYSGYWMEMTANVTGDYKVEVSGYMNGNYVKYFGVSEFTVLTEDEYWDYGGWF